MNTQNRSKIELALSELTSSAVALVQKPAVVFAVSLLAAHKASAQLSETFASPTDAVEFTVNYWPADGEFTFPQFDPALGRLTSVTLALSGNFDQNFQLFPGVLDPDTLTDTGSLTETVTLGVSGNSFSGGLSLSTTLNYSWDQYDNFFETFSVNGIETNSTEFTAPSILAEFTGDGTLLLPGSVNLATSFSPTLGGLPVVGNYDSNDRLKGTVTYDYSQSVPEPASLLVDLAPLSLLCAARYRFRVFRAVKINSI